MRLLLSLLAFVIASPPALARDAGTDWFLLTPDGKFVRKLDWEKEAVVDLAAEQIYRLKEGQITAFRLPDERPLWTAPAPVAGRWEMRWETHVPGVLLLIDNRGANTKAIHGFDKATGKELYRVAREDYWFPPSQYRGLDKPLPRDEDELGSIYGLKYKADALEGAAARWPNALARFDLRTGKRLWERPIPPPKQVPSQHTDVQPGWVANGNAAYYFDPATGEPLVGLKPEEPRSIAVRKNVVYSLSNEDAPTLAAHRIKPWELLWSVKGLNGVRYILREDLPNRLLCATESEVVVIDTHARRELSRFPAFSLPYADLAVMPKAIVVWEKQGFWAVDPDTGKTVWRYESTGEHGGLYPAGEQLLTVEDAPADPAKPGNRRNRKDMVTALAAANGKVQWRWRLPELQRFHDGSHVEVTPCKFGIVVKRWWFVAER